tara:strand:- start:31967 stop:32224 length:258 start_codon:yes stop_codon:yes gene_type:complete
MATTVQQANAPSQAAESFPAKAVYWLIAFAVIIGLGLTISMMRDRWIASPAGETYSFPVETPPEPKMNQPVEQVNPAPTNGAPVQ